ncbi:hypothetical protein OIU77_011476, partial [Salix suchowensis]
MVPQDVKDKATKDTVPMIDVTQFGYFKVLGKGFLPEKLLSVDCLMLLSFDDLNMIISHFAIRALLNAGLFR